MKLAGIEMVIFNQSQVWNKISYYTHPVSVVWDFKNLKSFNSNIYISLSYPLLAIFFFKLEADVQKNTVRII